MPTIQKFTISDFKGIDALEIDLEGRSTSPVLTLIGLNESGKTTILEAISHFVSGDKSVSGLFEGPYAAASALKLIPKHKEAAFTGTISVRATLSLDKDDLDGLELIARKCKQVIDRTSFNNLTVSRNFVFEDSNLRKSSNIWSMDIRSKTSKASSFSKYKRPTPDSGKPDLWQKCVDHIQSRWQSICYFPTFLVDMPARIYLEEHEEETALNRHYRFVLQDILDSLGENLSLQKHVAKRIRDFKDREDNPSWFSIFYSSPNKGPIDSVFQKLSNAITREVLGSWQRVFQRAISAKAITVEWHIDAEKNDLPFAKFYVTDGESRYAINERSLGFRWFFSFLLFTSFKKATSRRTIFIFDEPAANLHAKAQAELLTSFSKIASDGNKIIYSTHSHHMINPRWLGSAYIVENAALDYDIVDSFGLDTKPTKISATAYRKFVSQFPSRSSYFQPVIEKLAYVAPELVGSGPYVIVEGISDYYALGLAKRSLKKSVGFNLMPGTGSGSSGPLISQLMGQGQAFLVLLDDDPEGNKAAKRYREEWHLMDGVVLTMKDLHQNYSGHALEKIMGDEALDFMKDALSLTGKLSKKQIGWYLAEAAATDNTAALPSATILLLQEILQKLEIALKNSNAEAMSRSRY